MTGYETDDWYDPLLGQESRFCPRRVDWVWKPASMLSVGVFTGVKESRLEADYALYRGDVCVELYIHSSLPNTSKCHGASLRQEKKKYILAFLDAFRKIAKSVY